MGMIYLLEMFLDKTSLLVKAHGMLKGQLRIGTNRVLRRPPTIQIVSRCERLFAVILKRISALR